MKFYSKIYLGLYYLMPSNTDKRTGVKLFIDKVIGLMKILNFLPLLLITYEFLSIFFNINMSLYMIVGVLIAFLINGIISRKGEINSNVSLDELAQESDNKKKYIRFAILWMLFYAIFVPCISIFLAVIIRFAVA